MILVKGALHIICQNQVFKKNYLKISCVSRTRVAQWVRSLDYLTTHTSLSPIRRGLVPGVVNYKKGCTCLTAASDKVYQLLAHGRWFSPGTPASSTTKTGRHDITEILLKVALKHQKSKSIKSCVSFYLKNKKEWKTLIKVTWYLYKKLNCFHKLYIHHPLLIMGC